MLFSGLKGRKLVSTQTADTIGKVKGLVVDPVSRSVVALEFKKTPGGSVIAWGDLAGVGSDAVTVASSDVLAESAPAGTNVQPGKAGTVLKKRVLSSEGQDLGTVRDIDFDHESGALVSLLVDGETRIDGDRLLGIGSYAVVVRA